MIVTAVNRRAAVWAGCITLVIILGAMIVPLSPLEAQGDRSAQSVLRGVPEIRRQMEVLQQQTQSLQEQVLSLQLHVDKQHETASGSILNLARRVDDLEFVIQQPDVLRGFDAGGVGGNQLGPFPGTALYTMNIPGPGTYVVIAKMTASQRFRDGRGAGCRIIVGGDADSSQIVIPNPSVADPDGFLLDTASTITLLTSHTFVQQNEVILQCWNNSEDILWLSDIEVVAFKVNAHSVNPLRRLF